jgi:hypothetical protein
MIAIIGYGEVGKAINELYNKPEQTYIEDPFKHLPQQPPATNIEFVHICFPYSDKFINDIDKLNNRFRNVIFIVHSTIPIGTINSIEELIPIDIVHVPIRGIHPNLSRYMQDFVTYIGFDNHKITLKVMQHLTDNLGLLCKLVYGTRNTEAGKLLDTLYYGLCIEFHRMVAHICDTYALDYETVATDFNITYNDGYKITKPTVLRPVLYPPVGKIGGHCVIPNAQILNEQIYHWIIKGILNENEKQTTPKR